MSPASSPTARLVAALPRPIADGGRLIAALRPFSPPPPRRREPVSLGRLGSLEAVLAVSPGDVHRAQTLRFAVFYEEMAATANPLVRWLRRDMDRFDRYADHVLVVDHDAPEPQPFGRTRPKVVGTYRLMTPERARAAGGFYSAGEFDVARLIARRAGTRFLELGRSCVLPAWRQKRTIELLWTAVWAYARRESADVLFGCASFPGADAALHREALAFLHDTALAPEPWRVGPLPQRRGAMAAPATAAAALATAAALTTAATACPDRVDPAALDRRRVVAGLPPLIKAYLRLGAFVGDGAVADAAFATTDVLMILPVERIGERYLKYFG